jgi:hypothetical protein
MAGEEPKLIIDTDWKSQAQAEKERLAQKAAAATPKTASPAPAGAAGAPGEGDLPQEPGFQDLVGLLATQAMSYLGYYPDPQTGQAMISLEYAKLHIDMLTVLEEKTKNNLTDQEQKLLTKILSQLRMDFVEMSKAVSKAVQEGRIKSTGGGAGVMSPGAAPGIIQPPKA